MMQLSKRIPSYTKTVKFRWCKRDFLPMSEEYRKAREGKSPMDKCYWCNHVFVDGEMMALAQPEKGANRVLCQQCAIKL